MKPVKIFVPANRLAKIVQGNEGIAFEALVADCEKRLLLMKDELQAYVREQIREIVSIHAQGEDLMFARCKELGLAAMNIADVAGIAKLAEVGEAAHGIRAMIDSLVRKGVWHTDALELHITSLVLLSSEPAPSQEEIGRVLGRLRKMRAAIGVVE